MNNYFLTQNEIQKLIERVELSYQRELALFREENRKPLDPEVVAAEIAKTFAGLEPADLTGPLRFAWFNFEFLTGSKANLYLKSYTQLKHFHIVYCSEVDGERHDKNGNVIKHGMGLSIIGHEIDYGHFTSEANTRDQAVGFLVHPRLRLKKRVQYMEMANVQGIPDLRPALALELEDSVSGVSLIAVVIHAKSMRGGRDATSKVRKQQFAKLVKALKKDFPDRFILIAGDFNCLLGEMDDISPLTDDGYVLVAANDKTPTHQRGGRLDGMFVIGAPKGVEFNHYQVRNWWNNPNITREYSDHGCVSVDVTVPSRLTPMEKAILSLLNPIKRMNLRMPNDGTSLKCACDCTLDKVNYLALARQELDS